MRASLFMVCLVALVNLHCSSPYAVLKRYKGLSICVGSSGGFTGTTQGLRVDTEGRVYSFSGRLNTRREDTLFVANLDTTRSFYQRLDELRFSELKYDSIGNAIFFMELRSDTLIHRTRWTPADTTAPRDMRRLYADILSYVELHGPQSNDQKKD